MMWWFFLIITAEGGPHIIKDKLVEGVDEHMDAGDMPLFINREECELITVLREIDSISRKMVYVSAMEQFNEAMR